MKSKRKRICGRGRRGAVQAVQETCGKERQMGVAGTGKAIELPITLAHLAEPQHVEIPIALCPGRALVAKMW